MRSCIAQKFAKALDLLWTLDGSFEKLYIKHHERRVFRACRNSGKYSVYCVDGSLRVTKDGSFRRDF